MAARRAWAAVADAALGGAAAVVGVLASVRTYHHLDPWWVWGPVQVVGLSFTTAGLIARLRRPGYGTGSLMAAIGVVWYAMDLRYSTRSVAFAIGFILFYLSPVIFTHLVLVLPTGRLAARPERLVAAGLYLTVLVTQPMRYFTEHPHPPQSWTSPVTGASGWATVASALGLGLTLAAIWLVVRRWRNAGRATRRMHALAWITGAAVGLIVLVSTSASVLNARPDVLRPGVSGPQELGIPPNMHVVTEQDAEVSGPLSVIGTPLGIAVDADGIVKEVLVPNTMEQLQGLAALVSNHDASLQPAEVES